MHEDNLLSSLLSNRNRNLSLTHLRDGPLHPELLVSNRTGWSGFCTGIGQPASRLTLDLPRLVLLLLELCIQIVLFTSAAWCKSRFRMALLQHLCILASFAPTKLTLIQHFFPLFQPVFFTPCLFFPVDQLGHHTLAIFFLLLLLRD